jgi:acetoin utilization deacetylase AcuC-like enzyme
MESPSTGEGSMKLVWSPRYEADLLGHIFPVVKYRLTIQAALKVGLFSESDVIEAPRPSREDLLLVHTPEYIDDLSNLKWTHRTQRSEMALTREIVEAYICAAGGSMEAGKLALDGGICVHVGGGFHHAFADHAEGFCYVNDVAVAIARLRREGLASRAAVIDCDLHQGNGTARIFQGEPDVFTFSIHQENNYPVKEKSDLDIGLPDGADDEAYIRELVAVYEILDGHRPDIVFYLAGADPYVGDQLGGLALTKEGLRRRDRLVLQACRARGISVAVVFAGGYAADVMDDVDIHVATISEARRALSQAPAEALEKAGEEAPENGPGKAPDKGPEKGPKNVEPET